MSLDPQAKELLDFLAAFRTVPFHELGPEKARQAYNNRPKNLAPEWAALANVKNKNIEHEGLRIPVRIYTPIESKKLLPVLVFYHGGGMVIGSLDSYDTLCRQLALQSSCTIVSVDYRLAPENKFPAAVDDAYAALAWVREHAAEFNGDSQRIGVGGDSAGGSLAAVVAILARDRGIALRYQALIYPATAPHADHESQLRFARGYFLERDTILWFHRCYIRDDNDRLDFRYAPLVADDHSELAPALVIVADHDPLHDEGVAYAKQLEASGVDIELKDYLGMIHPFLSLAGYLDQGKKAIAFVAQRLKENL